SLAARAREPLGERMDLLEELDLLDLQPGVREERAPLLLRVAADVRRVAQRLRRLLLLRQEERVLDRDDPVGHARHLRDRLSNVREVVRGYAADDDVERAVRE